MTAKRETSAAKRAKRERGTNAQRRAREDQRGAIHNKGEEIAKLIGVRRYLSSMTDAERKSTTDYDLLIDLVRRSEQEDIKWMESQPIANIAKSLRIAADILEEKPPDGRCYSGHDNDIWNAFFTASSRLKRGQLTFREVAEVYREQNPRTTIEDRTLRRSLRRLGITVIPVKRGPKCK